MEFGFFYYLDICSKHTSRPESCVPKISLSLSASMSLLRDRAPSIRNLGSDGVPKEWIFVAAVLSHAPYAGHFLGRRSNGRHIGQGGGSFGLR